MRWFPASWWAGRGRHARRGRHRPGDAGARSCCCRSSSVHAAGAPVPGRRLERWPAVPGTRIVGVYEWALGDKSRRANAALTGLGATRRILVSDTMLADYSDDEIEVVLAHELGHHVHHDIWRGIALESALILLGLGVTDVVLRMAGPRLGCGLSGRPGRDAAAGAGGRHRVAGPDAAAPGAVATPRAPGRPVRAAADREPRRRSSRRCAGWARRTLPKSDPHAWSSGCSTATRRSKSAWPSPARGSATYANHRDTEDTEDAQRSSWVARPKKLRASL